MNTNAIPIWTADNERERQMKHGNERWNQLAMAIENEMFKIRVTEKELEVMVTSEAMLAAFNRVQRIMKELEEK